MLLFDKIENLKNYQENFLNDLNFASYSIDKLSRNLMLVNVNTPIVVDIFYNRFAQENVKITRISQNELNFHGSIGNYLRTNLYSYNDSTSFKNILFLDFVNEIKISFEKYKDVAYEININRDLFNKVFDSTIIFSSPDLTSAIMSYAIDFRSCLNSYINTTRWFCSPLVPPIFQIRNFPDLSFSQIKTLAKDKTDLEAYLTIKAEVGGGYVFYKGIISDFLTKAKQIHNEVLYIDLINSFFKNFCSLSTNRNNVNEYVNELENFAFSHKYNYFYTDAYIIIGDLFYRMGEYHRAIKCYEKTITVVLQNNKNKLNNLSENLNFDIIPFLNCNILICKYVLMKKHEPNQLLQKLRDVLEPVSNMSENYLCLKRDYLFLVEHCLNHHSYYSHKEKYFQLSSFNINYTEHVSILDAYSLVYSWERFVHNKFSSVYRQGEKIPVFSESGVREINDYLQLMLEMFCRGKYDTAKKLCEIIETSINKHRCNSINQFFVPIKRNMDFLLNRDLFLKQDTD